MLAQGETPETILTDYPDLEPDDLRACLAYAHAVIAHDKLDSVHISGPMERVAPAEAIGPTNSCSAAQGLKPRDATLQFAPAALLLR